jgi:outer membrane protein with beta-barrel domain
MRMLRDVGLVVAAVAALAVNDGAAQVRGLLGVGLGVPVGNFASTNDGGNAEAGGGTGLLGVEWLPEGRTLGLRVDGAYNRFCTSACNDAGGNLDQRYRFLNANLNGLLEVPLGNSAFRPYVTGGFGVYNYRLEGNDVPEGLDSQTDLGANAGLGAMYRLGEVSLFAEGRYHHIFSENSDIQYIPVLVGAKLDL